MQIEAIANYRCDTGENPLWDERRQRLYWCDIPTGRLFEFHHATGMHRQIYDGEPVGGFTMQEDGSLLLFRVNDIALLEEDGRVTSLIPFSDGGVPRFNDVIATPRGEVLAGTMGEDLLGGVYRVTRDGTVTCLWRGTNCSNGMAFTPDRQTFYWTNTTTRAIYEHAYEDGAGVIGAPRAIVSIGEDQGNLDGLALDNHGRLYSARWGGAGVFIYDPHGSYIDTIDIPVARATSCCLGGPNLDELYVTTSHGGEDEDPAAGTLYRVTGLGVKGLVEHRSQIKIAAH